MNDDRDECRMWIWRNGLSHTVREFTGGSIICGWQKPKSEPCCDRCKNRLSDEALDAICAGKKAGWWEFKAE